jgi:hypothetical protein
MAKVIRRRLPFPIAPVLRSLGADRNASHLCEIRLAIPIRRKTLSKPEQSGQPELQLVRPHFVAEVRSAKRSREQDERMIIEHFTWALGSATAQLRDQPQNVGEHLFQNRDLAHLGAAQGPWAATGHLPISSMRKGASAITISASMTTRIQSSLGR